MAIDPDQCVRCLSGKMRVTYRRARRDGQLILYRKCSNARCRSKDKIEAPLTENRNDAQQ